MSDEDKRTRKALERDAPKTEAKELNPRAKRDAERAETKAKILKLYANAKVGTVWDANTLAEAVGGDELAAVCWQDLVDEGKLPTRDLVKVKE